MNFPHYAPARLIIWPHPVGMQFLQVLNAENVQGRALGFLDFSFTEAQLNALRDFANRILLPRGNRRGRLSGTIRMRQL